MIHSDNVGLVLPPRVAQTQVIIVPIFYKDGDNKVLADKARALAAELKQSGIRTQVDENPSHNPGFKFAHWEIRGTPVRIELGSKDFDKQEVKIVVRHSQQKF